MCVCLCVRVSIAVGQRLSPYLTRSGLWLDPRKVQSVSTQHREEFKWLLICSGKSDLEN